MQRLFDIKRTQMEMVRDRGYDIAGETPVLTQTLSEFLRYLEGIRVALEQPGAPKPSVRSALSRIYVSHDGQRQLLVYYGAVTSGKELPVAVVRDFLQIMSTNNIHNGILITDATPSYKGRVEIEAYVSEYEITRQQQQREDLPVGNPIKIQVFNESDLTHNATQHIDVPVHELIPAEEEATLLKMMRTDKRHMLLIRSNDPIVRYYNWDSGRIIRIYRDDRAVSVLTPASVNYRVIIP